MSRKRLAVGGLHTECSTWNPVPMQQEDFRVLRGAAIPAHAEFAVLGEAPVDWVGLLHARAVPGGPVSATAYRAFKAEFLERLAAALPVDGVYLSMHGAVFVAGMADAEGDWIGAVRALVGPDCLVVASYDLHGNVSQRVVDGLDGMAVYRTAPHVDVDATKARAVSMLCRALDGARPHLAWARIPVLLPGERTSTEDAPARGLYAALPGMETAEIWEVGLLVGYVWADEARATASVVVTGTAPAAMARAAVAVARSYWAAREDFTFGSRTGSLEECLALADASATSPVVLADSGDNPTGGGVGDRGDVLAALVARDAQGVVLAGIADPPAVAACFDAGSGAAVALEVGGALDPRGMRVAVRGVVQRLHDPGGARERQAVLLVGGIEVVLTARRRPFHALADFTELGLDPARARLVVVKSGYLSPELAHLADPGVMALTEGVVNQDVARLAVRHVVRPCFPWDRGFDFVPAVLASAQASS